jgi:hypothetical protein
MACPALGSGWAASFVPCWCDCTACLKAKDFRACFRSQSCQLARNLPCFSDMEALSNSRPPGSPMATQAWWPPLDASENGLLQAMARGTHWPGIPACAILTEASRGQGDPCPNGDVAGAQTPPKTRKQCPS